MVARHDFPILWKRLHSILAYAPPTKVALALMAAALGAGVLLTLPDPSSDSPSASQPQQDQAALNAICEKQAWPYVDRRCADPVPYERGTRQVRVVTERGETLTMATPVPIIEPKRAQPPRPQVVAEAPKKIGPEVIPATPEQEATLQNAVAPSQPAKTAKPDPAPRQAAIAAAQTFQAPAVGQPVMAATNAFAKAPAPMTGETASEIPASKKSKAAAKAEKREAKQRTATERQDKAVPAEVVAAVEATARREQSRQEVPPEVIAAVERARANEYGGGQRVYVIQRPGW